MKYKPAAYVYLKGQAPFQSQIDPPPTLCLSEMHLEKPDSSELTKATHRVVKNEVISQLFAMIQRTSVEVSLGVGLV